MFQKDSMIYVGMYGDGAVICLDDEDKIYLDEVRYTANAPYYLSYQLDKGRDISYKELDNDRYLKSMRSIDDLYNAAHNRTHTQYNPLTWTFPVASTKALLVTSDGISSFLSHKKGLLESTNVARQLVNFKNTNGSFIQRRCNRMIKDLEKEGYFHIDDFSVGGFYFK